ncbi:MAG: SidA/IucD/PvdA family monooxygenase [Bacteroidota bacterium]
MNQDRSITYDFAAIGIGPFNLGLAALTQPIKGLKGIFFDQKETFEWHPGMMIEGTHLQVPFMADLVTMADPTSPYSFLNYCKQAGRLYNFYIKENFYLLREEYNLYCKWVIDQLEQLHFGQRVEQIKYSESRACYKLTVLDVNEQNYHFYYARKLVFGTGNTPYIPETCKGIQNKTHTASYLRDRAEILEKRSITIIGGGQSAAEVFIDLLQEIDMCHFELNWITRSSRYFPLEYSKLTLEMTSSDYVDYFHQLPPKKRDWLIQQQKSLYKGINFDLINEIYDLLYAKSLKNKLPIKILSCSDMQQVSDSDGRLRIKLFHHEQEKEYYHDTDYLILASGYETKIPSFMQPIRDRIKWDEKGRFAVNRNYSIDANHEIFVQNGELHTHGFVTPDLGMGAYRNAYIINEITGKEYFDLKQQWTFQHFGALDDQESEVHNELASFNYTY